MTRILFVDRITIDSINWILVDGQQRGQNGDHKRGNNFFYVVVRR